jgi:hypothetical protein
MSYAIVKVVYGVPLTEDCIDLINKWESDPNCDKWTEDDDGPCGFTSLYAAGGTGNGFCGVELDELDSYGNQLVSKVRMVPTKEEKKKAEKKIAELDPQLRELTGEVGVYFIWSDS